MPVCLRQVRWPEYSCDSPLGPIRNPLLNYRDTPPSLADRRCHIRISLDPPLRSIRRASLRSQEMQSTALPRVLFGWKLLSTYRRPYADVDTRRTVRNKSLV